ncbi:hypothetical protein GSY74_05520 [Sulfurovum sp. bin170]|nr:hypothetical protein [Sulfurovum sp. bin170]NEW60736.1 hypothetical protein [Sulfurovum sp. bin170]
MQSAEVIDIYVTASLVEEKKRRLSFEVSVEDEFGKVYARSKVVNWVIDK